MTVKFDEGRSLYRRLKRKFWSLRARNSSLLYEIQSRTAWVTSNGRNLQKLHDRHRGQRCFIIGNGPSLNLLDLTLLKNEVTFGVNAIYTNYPKMGYYPTYYVVEDTFVAEDRANEINAYRESVKFFGHYLKFCLRPDPSTLLLNVVADYREHKSFPRFSTNAARKVYVGGSVTYICMQLAYYMGFETVYLIGFDHNYTIPKEAIRYNDELSILSTSDDVNHFSKDYFGKGKRWHDPNVDRMERGFKRAGEYFEADGRTVYNATAGGRLELFERTPFDDLFKSTTQAVGSR